MPAAWPEPLPEGSYLLLTTFRKDGRAVATPVWFRAEPVPGGPPVLVAFSGRDAGKTKRLRHTSRVLVQGCTLRGKPLGEAVEARAELVEDETTAWNLRRHVGQRFRIAYPLWTLMIRLTDREEWLHPVGLRITLPAGP
jgi:PPOX class probable F420-dependent enzyme